MKTDKIKKVPSPPLLALSVALTVRQLIRLMAAPRWGKTTSIQICIKKSGITVNIIYFSLLRVPKDKHILGKCLVPSALSKPPCWISKRPWGRALSEHANVRENLLAREDATRGGNFRARSCGSLPYYKLQGKYGTARSLNANFYPDLLPLRHDDMVGTLLWLQITATVPLRRSNIWFWTQDDASKF